MRPPPPPGSPREPSDPVDEIATLFDIPYFMTDEFAERRRLRRPKRRDGTVFAGISPDTGSAMYALPDDESSHPIDFCRIRGTEIEDIARQARWCGYSDWRIPSPAELLVLHQDQDKIRGFGWGWYWTSAVTSPSTRAAVRFRDGLLHEDYLVSAEARLRLVRDNREIMFPRKDGIIT